MEGALEQVDTVLLGILLSAGAFLFFLAGLAIVLRNRNAGNRVASLSIEDPHTYARQATIAHMTSKKRNTLDWPLPRLKSNFKLIQSACADLNDDLLKKVDVPAPAEWLLDNFYIIESQYLVLLSELRKREYLRLPVLQSGPYKGYARVFAMAVELIAGTNNTLDDDTLTSYFLAYQAKNILLEREVRVLPIVLRLVNLEDIRCLCEDIISEVKSRKRADVVYDEFLKDSSEKLTRFHAILNSIEKTGAGIDSTFAEHLCYRLRRSERNPTIALQSLDAMLAKLGTSIDEVTQLEHSAQSLATISMESSIKRLHYFSSLDWAALLPAASRIEQILRQDSDRVYQTMDLSTRDTYKRQISRIAVECHCSEAHTAREALKLAAEAKGQGPDSERTGHVGFYFVDDGVRQLKSRLTVKDNGHNKRAQVNTRWTIYLSTIAVITAVIITVGALYGAQAALHAKVLYGILCGFALLLPASEIAMYLVNRLINHMINPALLPKLELKDGIPESLSTMVIIPTLLPNANRVSEVLQSMEEHYLRNREKNLYFAIIGAFGDADAQSLTSDEEVLTAALKGVQSLNATYAEGGEIFYFFHRKRQYNQSNQIWIGWERKRGAIMEFNDLMQGALDTSFVCASSESPPFGKIRYVITLDSETILPIGMAKRLVGTMAHPLNRPYIDETRCVVTRGYGLIQPHIEIESAGGTLFSRIFTNQEGIDPYSGALSDVYQDLFGEGIFTGKGIYDLSTFQTVLKGTIPENKVLSHDLLEGSYLRTGLATDLTMVDGYPAQYHAYAARQRRWIRGDWQLLSYLMPRLRDGSSVTMKNPLSAISKWKIYDNLRRSLLAPSQMVLVLLAVSVLPGCVALWLGFLLFTIFLPFTGAIFSSFVSLFSRSARTKRYQPMLDSLKSALLQGVLDIAFLPYAAWLSTSAIVLTLTRLLITKKNLLEWVTSAESEAKHITSIRGYFNWMQAALWQTLAIIIAAAVGFRSEWILLFLPVAILWLVSPWIAYEISKDAKTEYEVSDEVRSDLLKTARKTWRYFEEFASKESHHLAPDNYQAEPYKGVAMRTSPTNIGLGLLAVLTARDMDFIGTIEMTERIEKAITTVEGLPKWNGHLYNWYNTGTLKPLHPAYISTVDSGNLIGYLMTLTNGLQEYLDRPLIDAGFFDGLITTTFCTDSQKAQAFIARIQDAKARFFEAGIGSILGLQVMDDSLIDLLNLFHSATDEDDVWLEKAGEQTQAQLDMLRVYYSAALRLSDAPEAASEMDEFGALLDLLNVNCIFAEQPARLRAAYEISGRMLALAKTSARQSDTEVVFWLSGIQAALSESAERSLHAVLQYTALISRIRALISAVRFLPLYNEKKKLFSIGYHLEEGKRTDSYYDLLASEARLASYIAISSGEIPAAHWFNMGRTLTVVGKYKGLISWTGTMFEYLMPLLIMKSYRNTLLDETYSFAVKSQIRFGKTRNIPWGVSESAFNSLDKRNDYQYKAIGVPWLGLKRGLSEDSVVSPYATFLALLVSPAEAIQNIARLKHEHIEGPYGYYEAADYTKERLYFESKRVVIKSFMAHHQGMSLLAIDDYLSQNRMQARFMRNPAIRAYHQLLQEKVPANILLTKTAKEKVAPLTYKFSKQELPMRVFEYPDAVLPRAHVLTNGNYFVLLTDAGTGYSKNKIASMTRWSEDRTLDPYGSFFYLRDVESKAVWSATAAPLNKRPDRYEVEFSDDKAVYHRSDGEIDTRTEVFVPTDDNAEIRKITLKNYGDTTRTIEITSYCEVVLAPRATDLAHMAFSKLFIETDFHQPSGMVTAKRRPRSEQEKELWLGEFLVQSADQKEEIEFETDRLQFLGRGNNTGHPRMMNQSLPLSGTVGAVLDPIISLRTRVVLQPGRSASVSFVTVTAESRETLLVSAKKFATERDIELSALRAYERSRIETKYHDFKSAEIVLYLDMLSHILFLSPLRRVNGEQIALSHRGQPSLWRYSISGDQPILLVELTEETQIPLLHEAIKAYEYWGLMDIRVDLVVLVNEEHSYRSPLRDLVTGIVGSYRRYMSILCPDEIIVLNRKDMTQEDVSLLISAARVYLQGGNGSMETQLIVPAERNLPTKAVYKKKDANLPLVIAPEQALLYDNGIGGFRPDGKEYCIRLGHENTPAPWINVISNANFGFVVSESGSGYSWCENSHEFRLTPWSNDAVSDPASEVIYISDRETGRVFTPTALPIRDENPYLVRHGFGYTVFEHTCFGIAQTLTQFVPVEDAVKISQLHLKNSTSETRRLDVTYYLRPVLGVSDQTTAMHIQSSLAASGALLMKNPYNENFPGKICFLDCSEKERTVTGDRKEFFGSGGMDSPECLTCERLSGALGVGLDPCGAMRIELQLEPGEEKTIVFLLGIAKNVSEVQRISGKYLNQQKARVALLSAIAGWEETLGGVRIDTPDTALNLLQNGWLLYQVIACRLWARTGFYQSGGAFGFRDQLQDVLAVAATNPALARKQLLLHAKHQFTEGDVQHWWHEPHGNGVRTRFSDDFLWLPFVTAEYIRISGDNGILLELVPFLQSAPLAEQERERYEQPSQSKEQATLYEHCLRAIRRGLQFGVHGLPLMGGGDWNDGMNTVGEKGIGESVWLGWFLSRVLAQFAPICAEQGDGKTAETLIETRKMLLMQIEENAWDGAWYRRAYFDDGTALGSAHNQDCKIDSIAQTWAVLSGAGDPERAKIAMHALEDYLVNREDGLIKLLTPPFDHGKSEPGYIKGYVPGVRENGGQYTHAAAWVIIAFAKLGEGDKALALYDLINPIHHTSSYRSYAKYKTEPYALAADVYAVSPNMGRGGWSWYTGAAGWLYRAGLESILGIRKEGEHLVIEPCIPASWQGYTVDYHYLGATYHISIRNPNRVQSGIVQIIVDGIETHGAVLLQNDAATHIVDVLMG